jgi:hypothetical protein
MPKRLLPKLQDAQVGLGLPTIMDRALAAAHGSRYVHLAVFAIDIDRVYWLDPERTDLPFGWEVFLTERYLLDHVDASDPKQRDLLEATCADLMEESPGEPPLGGQLAFAVYDALQRGQLPKELGAMFKRWRMPPKSLVQSLAKLWNASAEQSVTLAAACLDAELSPPLAEPTKKALEAMRDGKLPGVSP